MGLGRAGFGPCDERSVGICLIRLDRIRHVEGLVRPISVEVIEVGASDRLRWLLDELGIPFDIPPELAALKALANSKQWDDGAHALTEVRNTVIHPSDKRHHIQKDDLYDLWKLAMTFLELAILRLLGFNGQWRDRMRATAVGQAWQVPWSVANKP